MIKQKTKGFTLIELLVVIAIIGILSTLAVVSLTSARARARDSRRIADVRNIQSALELYFTDNSVYPGTGAAASMDLSRAAGDTAYLCTTGGFISGATATCTAPATLLISIPPEASAGDVYTYTPLPAAGPFNNYSIGFTLEGTAGNVSGDGCATPSGIADGVC